MTQQIRAAAGEGSSPVKGNARPWGAVAGFVLAAALSSSPASAKSEFEDAHSLRSLDIMLMVTSLRCRTGAHDFRSDYHRFSAANLEHLNDAGSTLKRSLANSFGERNPARALDRMGVKIANSYGDGHPWLSCAELKQVAQDLSRASDAQSLVRSARYLLGAARQHSHDNAQVATKKGGEVAPQIARSSENVRLSYDMSAQWEIRP
ncbi:S-adenosyl-L-homocysteine hydrolase [Qipengyuania sp. S6317L1]|uniref:S-adenosyl-L-homocysteine hydrolase n=1 Tax=Qipengyuania sp. S6317L1 TaxID=2926410 RepID=UPI001FF2B314|nr:S-adenosyl-L-homocysteine hydrolase [Qipengyuania sp. S6317L1]MCK0100468.1 S-adenosyl-L-homocysteine hydrolase [Qipengyuania sp. S6317L1]